MYRTAPTLVSELEGIPITRVACGAAHTAAVSASGDLFTWGQGRNGALGIGGSLSHWSPQQVSFPTGWVVLSVSCGGRHTSILLKEPNTPSKSVYMCGAGEAGQLGLGRKEMELTPKKMSIEEEVEEIAVGSLHTLFLTGGGRVWATGNNGSGQLGTGTRKSVKRPVMISVLSGLPITHIAAHTQSAAVTRDNRLYIWGSGVFGEYLSPQRVKSAVEAESITLGSGFLAVLDVRGHLWTWGNNSSGELGHGDTDIRLSPFPVMALREKRLKSVACGGGFVIALGEEAGRRKEDRGGRREIVVEETGRPHRSRSTLPQSEPQTPSFYRECRPHIDSSKVLELELNKERQLRLTLQSRLDLLTSENESLRHSLSQTQSSLIREQRESAWRTQTSLSLSSDIEQLTKRAKQADILEMRLEELQHSLNTANLSKEKTQEMMDNSTRTAIDATKRAEISEKELNFARNEINRLENELFAAMKAKNEAQKVMERSTMKAEAAVQELTRRQEDLEMSWTLKTHSESSKVEAVEREVDYLRTALRKSVENGAENSAECEKQKAKIIILQRENSEKSDRIAELESLLLRHESKNRSLLEALESEVKSRANVLSRTKAAVSVGAENRSALSSSFLERTMRQGDLESTDRELFRGKNALEARMEALEQKISTLKRHSGLSADLTL